MDSWSELREEEIVDKNNLFVHSSIHYFVQMTRHVKHFNLATKLEIARKKLGISDVLSGTAVSHTLNTIPTHPLFTRIYYLCM